MMKRNKTTKNIFYKPYYKRIEIDKEKVPPMDAAGGDVSIAHIAGTIEVEEKGRHKKLLFRATRGKAMTFFL
jgi:hypothetical protein